jgi:hypothetical protein
MDQVFQSGWSRFSQMLNALVFAVENPAQLEVCRCAGHSRPWQQWTILVKGLGLAMFRPFAVRARRNKLLPQFQALNISL